MAEAQPQPAPQAGSSAVIFASGRLPNLRAARRLINPGDWLVAADGGARQLGRLGLLPHLLIGDMDSLTREEVAAFERAGVRLQRRPVEKDETDLELALRAALDRCCTRVRIAGAMGGRFDQVLGHLFLLMLPEAAGIDLRLDDGVEEVFLIRERGVIDGQPGDVVSLLPLAEPAVEVSTRGLKYPLAAETLYPHRTRGISNVMLLAQAEVYVSSGCLVCVHRRQIKKTGGGK